jgi:hypothetical protein
VGDRGMFDASQPDETVAFGDVSPSVSSSRGSLSEAATGFEDSTRSLGAEAEADEGEDRSRGISRERAPRAEGDVDTTPLSRRG